MKRPETLGGLIGLLTHTLASGVLQALALIGPVAARPRFSDLYWGIEWWAGALFDRIMSTGAIAGIAELLIKRGALDPYSAAFFLRGVLILLLGGAFYFAVGFCGTALFRSGRAWFRRRRALATPPHSASLKP